MNFLPVAQRELRVASRKPATYYSRSIAGLTATVISLGIVLVDFSGAIATGSSGQEVFYILSTLAYVFVCFEGAVLTCDCISIEKREGTLGLLFLTDLRGYDIVAGKLIPHVVRTFLYVLAAVPASAIAFVLGGISGADLFSMSIALINALFFSAAIGLLVSTCCWHDRHAIIIGIGTVVLLTIIAPIIGYAQTAAPAAMSPAWLSLGPSGAFVVALGTGVTRLPPSVFASSFVTSQIIAWTCLVAASCILPRWAARDRAHAPRKAQASSAPVAAKDDDEAHPEMSSAIRVACGARTTWVLTLVLPSCALAFVSCFVGAHPISWADPAMLLGLIMVMHLGLKFIVAERSCRALGQTRQTGELELLLTTPFDPHDILRSYALSLKRQLLPPVLSVIAADIVIVAAACRELNMGDGVAMTVMYVLEGVWLIMNLYSLSWVGLYMGMRSRTTAMALQRTLALVVVAPWIGFFVVAGLIAVVSMGSIFTSAFVLPAMALFAILVLFGNCALTAWAMNDLNDRFRELGSHQFIPRDTQSRASWRQWWRRFFLLER
jgi:ABC-type transport system involved in multi-copper enzyme maturation permease subunit